MFSSVGVALGDSFISPEDFAVCLSRALLIERENHIHIFCWLGAVLMGAAAQRCLEIGYQRAGEGQQVRGTERKIFTD